MRLMLVIPCSGVTLVLFAPGCEMSSSSMEAANYEAQKTT